MRGERKRVLFSLKTILFLAILVFLSVWQYQNTYIGQEDASQQRYDFYTEYIHQIAPLKKEEQESQIEMLLSEIEKELETGIAKEESEVSELLQRQNALLMVHEQRAYIEGYQEYLDKIQSDADYIQKGGCSVRLTVIRLKMLQKRLQIMQKQKQLPIRYVWYRCMDLKVL